MENPAPQRGTRRRRSARKRKRGDEETPSSASERLLFGGPLRYDLGRTQHEHGFLELNLRAMVARLPSLLASS
ncbi:hypothetical protein, partial [Streptomyces anthocyanicus]